LNKRIHHPRVKRLDELSRYSVDTLDLAVLLLHVHLAAKEPDIGYEDANHTLQFLTSRINKVTHVPREFLESALWSCNLMSEKGKFWHPRKGEDFSRFVKRLLPKSIEFDMFYNYMKEKKEIDHESGTE